MIGSYSTPLICPGPCERCGRITQNYGQCVNCLSAVRPDLTEPDPEQARAIRVAFLAKQQIKDAELHLRLNERTAA